MPARPDSSVPPADRADAARRLMLADYLRRVGGRLTDAKPTNPPAAGAARTADTTPPADATPAARSSGTARADGEVPARLATTGDPRTAVAAASPVRRPVVRRRLPATASAESPPARPGPATPTAARPPAAPTPAAPSPAAASTGASAAVVALGLSPRLTQTLAGLLAGGSEKQIAAGLAISPHTVHEYVKQLHKRLGVSSRGELLARFIETK